MTCVEDGVRLADVLAALAAATDLGMGQPIGHATRCCLIAAGLADALRIGGPARSDVFYVALLRYVGCTADAAEVARSMGDEIALAVAVAPHVMGDPEQERRAVGRTGVERAKAASIAAHCEAAGLLAERVRLSDGVVTAMRHGFERWDGKGHPAGLSAEEVPLPVRIAVVARDVDLVARRAGFGAAAELVRARRGRATTPRWSTRSAPSVSGCWRPPPRRRANSCSPPSPRRSGSRPTVWTRCWRRWPISPTPSCPMRWGTLAPSRRWPKARAPSMAWTGRRLRGSAAPGSSTTWDGSG